jgi:hypothetical protein
VFLEVREVAIAAFRVRVPAIRKGMDIYFGKAFSFANRRDGLQVVGMGVYAPVTDQAEEVQGFFILFGVCDRRAEGGILLQFSRPDGNIDPLKFLVDNPAGTDVEVPHFTVPHLAFRESHGLSVGHQGGVGIIL